MAVAALFERWLGSRNRVRGGGIGRGGDPGFHAGGVGGPGWPPSEDLALLALTTLRLR